MLVVFVVILAILALGVISLIGDYYLTRFAFDAANTKDTRSIIMRDWQVQFSRISTIMHWVTFGLAMVGASVHWWSQKRAGEF